MLRFSPDPDEERDGEQVESYNLIIGFYDDKEEPSMSEMMGLMCEVKKYFADFLGSQLDEPDVTTTITDIGWTFDEDCHTPLNVFFRISAELGDRSTVSADAMSQTMKLGNDEIVDLIENYVYESGNPFSDVNQLTFEASTKAASSLPETKIDEAKCPALPTPSPPTGTSPNRKGKWSASKNLKNEA